MSNRTVAVIGVGFMGSILIERLIDQNKVKPENMVVYDTVYQKSSAMQEKWGIIAAKDMAHAVQSADAILICVKPNVIKPVLESMTPHVKQNAVIASIAAGVPISSYFEILPASIDFIRIMPNTPCLIGKGVSLFSYRKTTGESSIRWMKDLFLAMGEVEVLDEEYMNAAIALTGSSPAYVYMMIEAMADASVKAGLPRELSYRLAASAVSGSAEVVKETGDHPAALKDRVCSPAGTTIEAVFALEKNGFRYALMDAMEQCTKKAEALSKGKTDE